jgi:tetratricopeptide (TPR) repeat protein
LRATGRALIAVICLGVIHCSVQAQFPAEATEAYRQGHWQLAIPLLEPWRSEPGALRMLALSYYHEPDFNHALPALEGALAGAPDDTELNAAFMEVLLAGRDYARARETAGRLEALGESDLAAFGLARIRLAEGERVQAVGALEDLVAHAEPSLATRAADVLIEALYEDHQYAEAYEAARMALQRDPDSELAYRFARIQPDPLKSPLFSVDLGYRFEYDDNVTYPDEIFASGKADYRHVLMADLLYQRPFADGWLFYAQGHALQSFHNDLDQFDRTLLSGSAAIGYDGRRLGWRLPLEVNHDRLDGDSYRTSVAALPGLSLSLGTGFMGHLYARLQSDEYDDFVLLQENRSGDVTGAGILLVGQVSPRMQVRSYVEFNQYDTDGAYWERDEIVAFASGEFEFISGWSAGLAFRYQDEDYDNARPVFAERQQDESREMYLNLTHRFAENWRWRGQVSLIDHRSNIPIFDYERNVYSISVVWGF